MSYLINLISKDNSGTITTTNVTNNVVTGFSVVEKLDNSLDVGQITLRGLTKSTPYTMFDTIEINYNSSEIYSLRIASDDVTMISKKPKLYKHDLTLVEHTKILELYIVSAKTFTQPTDGTVEYYIYDVLETLINTTPLEVSTVVATNRPIVLPTSGDLYDLLTSEESPEFTFKDLTLRETFNQVCDAIDGIPRLFLNTSGELELTIDFVNELKELISDTDDFLINIVSQNTSFHATQLDSEAINLVSNDNVSEAVEIYPSRDTYTTFRREDDFFQSDYENCVIPTPKEIYSVPAVVTWADVLVENTTKSTFPFNGARDWRVTSGIVEENIYNQLEFNGTTMGKALDYDNYKENCIYYRFKQKNIVLGTTYGLFSINEVSVKWFERGVKEILKEEGIIDGVTNEYDDDYTITINLTSPGNSLENRNYRVEYIPFPSSQRLSAERSDTNDVNRFSQLLSNQQNRILNIENYTNNMEGRINRIGNSELMLEDRVSTPLSTTILSIGDYTDDLYILTEKEVIFTKDFVRLKYSLSKNFNKISSFIGVNSEIRQWEISEKNTLERNLLYKEYIEIDAIDSGSGSNSSEIFKTNGRTAYLDTFKSLSTYESVSTGTLSTDGTTTGSIISTSSNGGGNSLIFNFKVDDNVSVGFKKETTDSKVVRQYVPYTDSDGKFENMTVDLVDTMERETFFGNRIDEADAYPEITLFTGDTSYRDRIVNSYITGGFKVLKDNREIIAMTLQISQIPKDLSKVVLGRVLSTRNRMVTEDPPSVILLYTYTNGQKFGRLDNKRRPDGWDTSQSVTLSPSYVDNNITVSHANLTADKDSWCLTDEDGNILIAVNQDGTLLNVLTFDFLNKRSQINYKY